MKKKIITLIENRTTIAKMEETPQGYENGKVLRGGKWYPTDVAELVFEGVIVGPEKSKNK